MARYREQRSDGREGEKWPPIEDETKRDVQGKPKRSIECTQTIRLGIVSTSRSGKQIAITSTTPARENRFASNDIMTAVVMIAITSRFPSKKESLFSSSRLPPSFFYIVLLLYRFSAVSLDLDQRPIWEAEARKISSEPRTDFVYSRQLIFNIPVCPCMLLNAHNYYPT